MRSEHCYTHSPRTWKYQLVKRLAVQSQIWLPIVSSAIRIGVRDGTKKKAVLGRFSASPRLTRVVRDRFRAALCRVILMREGAKPMASSRSCRHMHSKQSPSSLRISSVSMIPTTRAYDAVWQRCFAWLNCTRSLDCKRPQPRPHRNYLIARPSKRWCSALHPRT
jgi:hypothetical protein